MVYVSHMAADNTGLFSDNQTQGHQKYPKIGTNNNQKDVIIILIVSNINTKIKIINWNRMQLQVDSIQ